MAWRVNLAVHVRQVVCGLLLGMAIDAVAVDGDVPVRIAGSSRILDAPTKVADGRDFFNQGGLPDARIEVVYAGSEAEALDWLRAGQVGFALAATTPVALALMEALPAAPDGVVILASVGLSSQPHHVLARLDHAITSPADLRQRRVGLTLGTSAHHGWVLFASYHGIDPSAVTLVDLPAERLGAALTAGDVDAVVAWEPWADAIHAQVSGKLIAFPSRHLQTVNWLLVSRRDLLNTRPQLADRVVAGYRDALEVILHAPAEARELHAARAGLSTGSLERLEAGVIWSLALNLSVLANMELQFAWLGREQPRPASRVPLPASYLEPGPLARVAPDRLALPAYLYEHPTPGSALP